jgi:hypothetical protein
MAENVNRSSLRLRISTSTWDKDSVGLYDFKSTQMKSASFSVSGAASVVISHDAVFAASEDSLKSATQLLGIERRAQEYLVFPAKADQRVQPSEKMWIVVGNRRFSEYRLSVGDIIRLGRAKLRVKEMSADYQTPQSSVENLPSDKLCLGGLNASKKHYSRDVPGVVRTPNCAEGCACRTCYTEDNTDEDPLISVCKCDGSLKYLHLRCLQNWMNVRGTVRQSHMSSTYTWDRLFCELCKTPYPLKLNLKDRTLNLISLPKPKPNYIILEELTRSTPGAELTYHYISPGRSPVSIGRGHESDVRIDEISVSRSHATLKIKKGGVYLSDSDSKFGTLVEVTRGISMTSDSELTVQTGKTLLTLSLIKQRNFWSRCFAFCGKTTQHEPEIDA